NFIDVTTIIFCHDYKWDNRQYPFNYPKSLLEVNGKTVISIQIETFSKTGIKNFVITIPNNTKQIFIDELQNNFSHIHFDFIEINSEIKTGTALKLALKSKYTKKTLLISNGDIYYGGLNIDEYFEYHKNQNSDFSLCLKFVLNPEQLGNVQINGNKIINFVERPQASQMNLTNSGLYITTRKFLDKHNFGDYLEKDFFPQLPDMCNNIGYIYSGQWEHIQNDSAYERVNGWLI
ncbi:MAG: sugar phosphate nucleotidyltransferase, partial [Candidatus Gracilibacteria bacterium]|nr:sugar phosphate nucleotidyltransferase [Candidatus Gracilibacteria bacterium]